MEEAKKNKMNPTSKKILIGMAVFIAIVCVLSAASSSQKMDSSKALDICSKAAQESDKLVAGTKVVDKEATENYNEFKEDSSGNYIRNWRGKYKDQDVDFDCFITKDGVVTRLLANYGSSSETTVWLIDDRGL